MTKQLRHRLDHLSSDTSGGSAIILALSLPIVIGGIGLAVDVGLWYQTERRLQGAADMAAFSGAVERAAREDLDVQEISSSALEEARRNRFRGGDDDFAIDVAQSGNREFFRVTLREDRRDIFSSVLAGLRGSERAQGKIRVAATATVQTVNDYCLLALSEDADRAIEITGNQTAALTDCSIHSNSGASEAIYISGASTVSADTLSANGGIRLQGAGNNVTAGEILRNRDDSEDPFSYVTAPARPDAFDLERECNGCSASADDPLQPGYYPDGIDVQDEVNLAPGTYWLGGDLRMGNNETIRGDNVTIFFGEDKAGLNGVDAHAVLQLTAPAHGPLAGIAIYLDHDDEQHINAGTRLEIDGAIYAPNAEFHLNGAATEGSDDLCFQLVAQAMKMNGTNEIISDCSGRENEISRTFVGLVDNTDFPAE